MAELAGMIGGPSWAVSTHREYFIHRNLAWAWVFRVSAGKDR